MAKTRGGVGRVAGTRGGGGRIAGTRGGFGRIAAMAIGLAVVMVLVFADGARAGNYNVAQCGWGIGVELDPALPRTEGDAAYLRPGFCTGPSAETPGLAFDLGLANNGSQGVARARWAAPAGTSFVGASFTWAGQLAVAVLQIAGIADDRGFESVALDVGATPPRFVAASFTTPVPTFEVRLQCLLLGPTGCVRSVPSSMWMSGLTLTVDDLVPPQARLGGTLAASGWHRGTVPLEVAAEDPAGAGLYREEATVDGAPVLAAPVACAVATIGGEVRATRLRPCPMTAAGASAVDTTALADGVHALRGCAVDFGGGQGCAPVAQIQVDNSPPEVEFAAAPEGQVAAAVSDAFSGPAAGTIAVRRADSETWADLQTTIEHGAAGKATLRAQLPDLGGGAFFFRATATDGAGNSGSAQFRAAGGPAGLRQQVAGAGTRSGGRGAGGHGRTTRLVAYLVRGSRRDRADRAPSWPRLAVPDGDSTRSRPARPGAPVGSRPGTADPRLTVDYGTAVELRGWLADAHGRKVPNRPVAVVVRPAAGGGAPGRPSRSAGGCVRARRGSPPAASSSRSSTSSAPAGAGVPPSSSAPGPADASRLATASATSPVPPASACGRLRCPKRGGRSRPDPRPR
jgi:hypothetical protein